MSPLTHSLTHRSSRGITATYLTFVTGDSLYSYNPRFSSNPRENSWFRTPEPNQEYGPHIRDMLSLEPALMSLVKYLEKCPKSQLDFTGHTCRSSTKIDSNRLQLHSDQQWRFLGSEFGCGCGTNSAKTLKISFARSMELAYYVAACYFTEPNTRRKYCPIRATREKTSHHLNWGLNEVNRFVGRRIFREDDSMSVSKGVQVKHDLSLITAPINVFPITYVEGAGGSRCLAPNSFVSRNRRVSITVWHPKDDGLLHVTNKK